MDDKQDIYWDVSAFNVTVNPIDWVGRGVRVDCYISEDLDMTTHQHTEDS